jgi:hypothetical protein
MHARCRHNRVASSGQVTDEAGWVDLSRTARIHPVKVFKPGSVAGPVQGPGFGFWPGRPGQFLFLKKIQNGIVLVKKKFNGLQPGFWPGFAGSTGSWLMLFFHQHGPVLAPGRPGPGSTLRAGPGFKTLYPVHTHTHTHAHILWICSLVLESRVLYFLGCSIFSNTEIGNIHRQISTYTKVKNIMERPEEWNKNKLLAILDKTSNVACLM